MQQVQQNQKKEIGGAQSAVVTIMIIIVALASLAVIGLKLVGIEL